MTASIPLDDDGEDAARRTPPPDASALGRGTAGRRAAAASTARRSARNSSSGAACLRIVATAPSPCAWRSSAGDGLVGEHDRPRDRRAPSSAGQAREALVAEHERLDEQQAAGAARAPRWRAVSASAACATTAKPGLDVDEVGERTADEVVTVGDDDRDPSFCRASPHPPSCRRYGSRDRASISTSPRAPACGDHARRLRKTTYVGAGLGTVALTRVAPYGHEAMADDARPTEPTPDEVRIVLADDHEVVRAGLRLLLEAEPGFEVVAEAGDVDGAVRYTRGHKPAVLVLDLNMPGAKTSLEAIPDIKEASPATNVVILTMQDDPAFARSALQAGALGYVLKEAADDELIEAVHRAADGDSYLNPRLGAALASLRPNSPPDELTERETEVLRLIALGHTNAEIAEQLHLSVRTVESHRAHIQQKLRRTTRAELVRYALDRGLVK